METILDVINVSKVYPNGVVANKNVNLSLHKGEIHAIVGENGAGKSTLMKILFGMEAKTDGVIKYEGNKVNLKSPIDAISRGICMVHQHFMLVPSLTVAENIVLGMEPSKFGVINFTEAVKVTRELAEKYHFDVNPEDKIKDLSVGTKQKVEILKALYRGAKLLILDEPTAVLTPQETEELFKELLLLKKEGHTIVFISHKLNEVKEICDRLTVMRKGQTVGVFEVAGVSKEDISNLMVGKEFDWKIEKTEAEPSGVALKIKHASKLNSFNKTVLDDVSLSLRYGEILGVVGVEGNGQTELIEGLTGYVPYDKGSLWLNSKEFTKPNIKAIRDAGLVYIPQDRMTVGIAKDMSIQDNMISTFVDDDKFCKKGVLNKKFISEWVNDNIEKFSILAKNKDVEIGSLSGGNIQKVVVAREVSGEFSIVIADQPTRGIDIGAATFIRKKLVELRDKGAAVMVSSADLTEVLDLSDSIVVMYNGKIVAYFSETSGLDEKKLGLYMLGLEKQSDEQIGRCAYE